MTYASIVAGDSPVGWWKLNESSGTTANDSGSGTAANGTYTGGYTLGTAGIDEADSGGGTSVKFNGTSGYITVGSLPSKLQFASGTAFSIEAWCYLPSNVGVGPGTLVSEGYEGDGNVRYVLGFDNDGASLKPAFGWYNGAWRRIASATNITAEAWHHIVGTFDGTQQRLYVDGSLVAGPTTPGGAQPTGTETLYIARRWDTAGWTYFNGWVDEVAMYASALSSTQVSNHYGARNLLADSEHRVTQVLAEVASPGTPERRVTQLVAEVGTPGTPQRQVSQLVVEVACKQDIAGWDVIMLDEHYDQWTL